MDTLLIENNQEELLNQLKLMSDFLIYYNITANIKIGNKFPKTNYNTLICNDKINILTNDKLLNPNLLNNLNLYYNEVVFKNDNEILLDKNTRELSIINIKNDLATFYKKEKKGTMYVNTISKIKILYPNKFGKMLKLYEYNFKCAIETKNRICIFNRGSKIKSAILAKQNNFELRSNYHDNPTVYKFKKLHK